MILWWQHFYWCTRCEHITIAENLILNGNFRRNKREISGMDLGHPNTDDSTGWEEITLKALVDVLPEKYQLPTEASASKNGIITPIFHSKTHQYFSISGCSRDKQDNSGLYWGDGRCQSSLWSTSSWPSSCSCSSVSSSFRWQLNDCLTTTVQTSWFRAYSCLPWWDPTSQYLGSK